MISSILVRSASGPRRRMLLVPRSASMTTGASCPRGVGGSMARSVSTSASARAFSSGRREMIVSAITSGTSKLVMSFSARASFSGGPCTTMALA